MLKAIYRTISNYWFPLSLGLVLTAIAVPQQIQIRGDFFIGGEWFITPVFCIIHYGIRQAVKAAKAHKRRQIHERNRIKGGVRGAGALCERG